MSDLMNRIRTIRYSDVRVKTLFTAVSLLLSRLILYAMYVLLRSDMSLSGFLDGINRFDSKHYLRIIEGGYSLKPINMMGEGNWCFFPLYPSLIRGIRSVTGAEPYAIAFLTGLIFAMIAIVMGMEYMALRGAGLQAQYIFAFLMTFGCYSFFMNLLYTESLYLLLLILCFYFLEKRQYLVVGVIGLFLTLTRNMGVFFEFVILARWIMFCYEDAGKNQAAGGSAAAGGRVKRRLIQLWNYFRESLGNPGLVLGVSLIPAGLFSFMLYSYVRLGDGLAFVNMEYGWRRENSFFALNLLNGLKEIDSQAAYLALWAVFGLWLAAILIFGEKAWHEAVWALLVLLIPMQSAMDSVPRYMFGAFVFYRVLASLTGGAKWYNKVMVLALFAGYELILFNGWLYGAGVLT